MVLTNHNEDSRTFQKIIIDLPMLSITCIDEIKYYLWYLQNSASMIGFQLNMHNSSTLQLIDVNIPLFASDINNEICRLNQYQIKSIEIFHSQMESAYKNYNKEISFSLNEIQWLKKDERACYWFWSKISTYHQQVYLHFSNQFFYENLYQKANLSVNPVGTAARFENIAKYFQIEELIDKKTYWNQLKQQWDIIINSYRLPLSWVKGNKIQKSWAINYLKEYTATIPLYGFLNATIETETNLPLSIVIDQLRLTNLEKSEFLRKMSSAWNQFKVRQKKSNKKAINAYISIEHKDRLDNIAKSHNRSIENTIEMLLDFYTKHTLKNDNNFF